MLSQLSERCWTYGRNWPKKAVVVPIPMYHQICHLASSDWLKGLLCPTTRGPKLGRNKIWQHGAILKQQVKPQCSLMYMPVLRAFNGSSDDPLKLWDNPLDSCVHHLWTFLIFRAPQETWSKKKEFHHVVSVPRTRKHKPGKGTRTGQPENYQSCLILALQWNTYTGTLCSALAETGGKRKQAAAQWPSIVILWAMKQYWVVNHMFK